jgi:hypothetical protein
MDERRQAARVCRTRCEGACRLALVALSSLSSFTLSIKTFRRYLERHNQPDDEAQYYGRLAERPRVGTLTSWLPRRFNLKIGERV